MSIRTAQFTALALLLAATAAMADGASWDRAGNVELQSRLFARDALWPGQGSQAAQLSLAATAELRWRNAEGDQRASIIPFLRRDSVDEERNLVDLQEA
jgi:hypothetical protein